MEKGAGSREERRGKEFANIERYCNIRGSFPQIFEDSYGGLGFEFRSCATLSRSHVILGFGTLAKARKAETSESKH
jgi:hypothetical protein